MIDNSHDLKVKCSSVLRYALLTILSFILSLLVPVAIAIAFSSGPLPAPEIGQFTWTDLMWILVFLFVLSIFHVIALLPISIGRRLSPGPRATLYLFLAVTGYVVLMAAAYFDLPFPAIFFAPFWGSFILPALDYYWRQVSQTSAGRSV